jgi:hypothetical protein
MVRANERSDPQKNPQQVDDDWGDDEAAFRWLDDAFRSWGQPEPKAIVVERARFKVEGQVVNGFGHRPLLSPSGPVGRGGRPPKHMDPTRDYEQTRGAFERRGWHLSDVMAAELMNVSVRTIETWRADGLIGGGRKRSG